MVHFEWDQKKSLINIIKHGISFSEAERAFKDPSRRILKDFYHSTWNEERWFCIGEFDGRVVTVRFVYRDKRIRIIGAGYWRKGKRIYEKKT